MTSLYVTGIVTSICVSVIMTSVCVGDIDMTMYDFCAWQEERITAMLGSFVDIQPDGSDSP